MIGSNSARERLWRGLPLRAGGGLREVWLVDPEGETVEVYQGGPFPADYTEVRRPGQGQTLAPVAVPDLIPAVDESLEAAPTGNAGTEP